MSSNRILVKDRLADKANESEAFFERLFFHNRPALVLIFLALTIFFGYHASQIKLDASFEKMIPTSHPYIANYLEHKEDIKGMGNTIRIAVEVKEGDIYTEEYMEVLKQVHDATFYIPGVDRAALTSLWASSVRWLEVTERGFDGGPVIHDTYDGSEESLNLVRRNVAKSGQVGALVANDARSAMVYVPLLDNNPETGEPLN